MSREIKQTIEINEVPKNIFNALLHPSAISEWWGAKTAIVVKENNGIYAVSWGDNIDAPDFVTVSTIKNLLPSTGFSLKYVSYMAKTGSLPFEAKMMVHFAIKPFNTSICLLTVNQTGIPDDPIADDYYEGCINGWTQVLKNIKAYCEKNVNC